MKIGGFEKQSFIDWEGRMAAVIFTKGCNFRCGYCHNPELVYPELMQQNNDISEDYIFDFLLSRQNWLDGVVITGGEPTLQRDLQDFIKRIKKTGYAIKLDTNGSNPMVLKTLIENKLIDYVAMDIKTCLELKKYQEICAIEDPFLLSKIEESIEILRKSSIDYQLRTTVVPQFHTKEIVDNLQKYFFYCNYKIQEFREIKSV